MTGDKTPKLPEPEDLQVLCSRITEPVETKIGCEAIHSVGLCLGPMFQVARKLWRGDSSIGKTVSGLKIFGGVGKVTVARQESFSRFSGYWVHLRITESLESSQTFNFSVLADDGALMSVEFRAVKPEQIQMAIAVQGTKEDEKIYDMDWSEWSQSPSEASDDKEPMKLLAAADTSDLFEFTRILLAFGGAARSFVLEGLLAILHVLQALVKGVKRLVKTLATQGMAARARTSESSIALLKPSKGLVQATGAILAAQSSLRTPILAVARIQWSNLLAQLPRVPSFLGKLSVARPARGRQLPTAWRT